MASNVIINIRVNSDSKNLPSQGNKVNLESDKVTKSDKRRGNTCLPRL